jgi:hypothetical protein
LLAGKAILRFVVKEEDMRSKYVLAGTMLSFALAILTGVVINALL